MTRRSLPVLLGMAGIAIVGAVWAFGAATAQPDAVQWIWFDEGDPLVDAPAETRYFRRTFTINRPVPKPVDEGKLSITADNSFTVWINGVKVGAGSDWKVVEHFDVTKLLVHGKNVVAVEAHNEGAAAGLLVKLGYIPNGMTKMALVSDGTWKSSKSADKEWEKVDFDDSKWPKAKVLGEYGKVGPWQGIAWGVKGSAGTDRFTVPQGFRVEQAVKTPDTDRTFSLINMTFDDRGRLLISREGGPTLLCTDPDKNGILQTVKPYCMQVKNSQGMCWVKNALLLVGDGPKGTGLYRCKEAKTGDHIEEVTLLHQFKGGMGEHGPHAILHGPDGWLYLVIGNHAWARPDKLAANSPLMRWPNGQMGPDQNKPGSTEDVLLPRLNDARGHAADILAPGGTIWRLDHEGKNMSLVAAGFRNHFDAAFSPDGELFTFDSDMEWDEDLPWYRAVRVCHCPPGADFLWRTGAANTPDYYIDSLPPLLETGRGSPVGLEFYDHHAFPVKYRGAYFMADWSIGVIWAVHLKRQGASYTAKAEKFCIGNPMPVTDLAVAPDGSLVFTSGGRNSQGGVFRIVAEKPGAAEADRPVQPLAAWSPQRGQRPALPEAAALTAMLADADPAIRAKAVWLIGVNEHKAGRDALIAALEDRDAFVRRRACEALIRAGIEPPVDAIWPLLSDADRFVRTAARLVLQRIDPTKWAGRIQDEKANGVAWEAIIALCKTEPRGNVVWSRLHGTPPTDSQDLLDYLRTLQMLYLHDGANSHPRRDFGGRLAKLFPHTDWRVNRELAILLTHIQQHDSSGEGNVVAKLLDALLASQGDRKQQISYFYCLRLLKDGWTPDRKRALAAWYDTTKTWTGGHSFTPFLENIFRETLGVYDDADRRAILADGDKRPLPALVLAQRLQAEQRPELLPAVAELASRVAGAKGLHRGDELRQALAEVLVRTTLRNPGPGSFNYLVQGLHSPNKLLLLEVVEALRKQSATPAKEDPAPYRALLLAAGRLDENSRWKVVQLLQHWSNGRKFGGEDGDWKVELGAWSKWFAQAFPKEAPLPNVAGDKAAESKYKYADLLAFLEKGDGRTGDATRGRAAFEKAQCLKCHKYGKEGEGIGPDLTTLSKRFKRADVLESLVYPSKVISDQYRSTLFVTKKGQQVNGLAAVQGDAITVLLSDGTKVSLKTDEVEQQFASLVSVMPEKLLDMLELREIADLFAYLESEPSK